ncbi:MAG: hypothetical protein HQ508_01245 [Candidatus Marinimicrobia bacterium]|nr:hypothetical protein [Candidatus Neomarinimicrobiota bacterium]
MTEMYLEMTRLFFILGGIFALGMGLLLFIKPETVARLSTKGNKWYSSEKIVEPLDTVHETDSYFFANHKIAGISMIFFSILSLYLIATRIPTVDDVYKMTGNMQTSLSIGILLESLKWFLLLAITLGLPVWGFLAFNPEKLKMINGKLNKWVSTRLMLLPLEKMNLGFDKFVIHYHRFFGAFFALGAVFILFKFLW